MQPCLNPKKSCGTDRVLLRISEIVKVKAQVAHIEERLANFDPARHGGEVMVISQKLGAK
jgi:hypothetical protein